MTTTIRRRLAAARAEVARGLASYDYVVVNEVLDDALAKLEAIARHERRARRAGRPPIAAAAGAPTRRLPARARREPPGRRGASLSAARRRADLAALDTGSGLPI